MIIIYLIGTVLLFSLGINAYYKITSYKKKDKTVWQDGDSIQIKRSQEFSDENGFMTRIK